MLSNRLFNSETRLGWLLFLGVALAYAFTLTKNYYWDGIHFALTIEQARGLGTSLLHPNHLIYNIFAYGVYRAVNAIVDGTRSLFVMQYLNCIFGAASVVVLFRILSRLLGKASHAFWLSVVFAFSATWWKYATDADAYIISTFFVLIGFYLLLPGKTARPFAVAGVHVAAMCFHQLAVLFVPVVVLALYFKTREAPVRRRMMSIAPYLGTAGVVTLGLYALAYYFTAPAFELNGFWRWTTLYSPEIGFVFDAFESTKHTARSMVQLFFSGRLNYLSEVPLAIAVPGAVLLAASLVWVVVEIVRYRREARAETPSDRQAILLCLVWIAAYLVFLFFFIPQNAFYRLFYLPAIIVLAGLYFRRRRAERVFAGAAAVLFLANLLFFIYPYSRVRAGTPLALVNETKNVWTDRTVVLYQVMTSDSELAWYFNPRTTWVKLPAATPAALDAALNDPAYSGRDIWIETILIRDLEKTAEGAAWLAHHTAQDQGHFQVGGKYDVRFTRVRP